MEGGGPYWKTGVPKMNTMKAFRIHCFGGVDALQCNMIPIPKMGHDQLIVRVHAASINPVDFKIRQGKYPMVGADKLPITLGRDFAGVVEHAGEGVSKFKPGDAVYGLLDVAQGSYAEFVVVKEAGLALKPRTLDYKHAAGVPLAALTAWQGLFDHGGLEPGQRVLIHAGAGGVGHFAVQFSKGKGAQTYATASGEGVEFVRGLGADCVIDYTNERFENVAHEIDLVLDLVAGDTQDRSWQVLKEGGALISSLRGPSKEEAERLHVRGARFLAQPNGQQLAEIGALIDDGKVRIHLAEVFPFDEAPNALARVESGHVHGKIVIDVDALTRR